MNIAIIDDFKADREKISDCAKTYFSNHYLLTDLRIQKFDSAEAFLETFASNAYDLIFIDYYLKGITGLALAHTIRGCDSLVEIVFVSVSPSFAVDGYKVHASGYLVKPFSYEDFSEIFEGLRLSEIEARQFIEITDGYENVKILLKDILYCDIFAHYMYIHTISMGIKRCRMTFSSLSKLLDPYPQFLACYRGCLVNMDHIIEVGKSDFRLSNGDSVPFSRKKQQQIIQAYSDYLFYKARCTRA